MPPGAQKDLCPPSRCRLSADLPPRRKCPGTAGSDQIASGRPADWGPRDSITRASTRSFSASRSWHAFERRPVPIATAALPPVRDRRCPMDAAPTPVTGCCTGRRTRLTQLGCRDLAAGVVVLIGTGGGGAAGASSSVLRRVARTFSEAPLHLLQLGRLTNTSSTVPIVDSADIAGS